MVATCGTVHAAALNPFCPVRVAQVHRVAGAPDAPIYSVTLEARGALSVSGTIAFHADDTWYALNFPTVALTPYDYRRASGLARFTQRSYESKPFYAQFPVGARFDAIYVMRARDAQGTVSCTPPAGVGVHVIAPATPKPIVRTHARIENPRTDVFASPPPSAIPLRAVYIPPPGRVDCALAFAPAQMTFEAQAHDRPWDVDTPRPTEAIVDVLVAPTGAVVDARIHATSGDAGLDRQALRAARHSVYAAGRAFCKPTWGEYRFPVIFR